MPAGGSGSDGSERLTPSARIVAEAAAPSEVTDALGRVLEVRRPGALDRLRLFKALGPALAQNERYVGYAMLAMCVARSMGCRCRSRRNEGQLEALVQRLGDAGMVAIGQGVGRCRPGKPGGAAGLDDPAALGLYTQTAELRDSLFLVRNGVPFDVAFSLDAAERRAWVVVVGELEGLVWDYAPGVGKLDAEGRGWSTRSRSVWNWRFRQGSRRALR